MIWLLWDFLNILGLMFFISMQFLISLTGVLQTKLKLRRWSLIFVDPTRKLPMLLFNSQPIGRVASFQYLGTICTGDLKWCNNCAVFFKKSKSIDFIYIFLIYIVLSIHTTVPWFHLELFYHYYYTTPRAASTYAQQMRRTLC